MTRLPDGDAGAVRMTGRLPEPCTEPTALDCIRLRPASGEHVFAIETLKGGEFVGCIGFMRVGDEAGLGYWLGRPPWSHGRAENLFAAGASPRGRGLAALH